MEIIENFNSDFENQLQIVSIAKREEELFYLEKKSPLF